MVSVAMNKREIAIPLPCTVDWRKMTPRDGGRFCGDCKKVVRDLSKMTEEEARALLRTPPREGLCVRLVHDARGQIFFAGMQTSNLVPASLLRRAKRAAVQACAAIALPFAAQACTLTDAVESAVGASTNDPTEEPAELMGGVAADPSDYAADAGADAQQDATDTADASPDDDADDSAADAGDDAADAPDAHPHL
jgi:hypothetical protein